MNALRLCLAAAAAGLLAACGDSPYEPEAPAAAAATVPAGATASTAAYTAFAASLRSTESGEPLALDGVTPPLSETEEAAPLS